jgi:hypothetical protein
MVCAAIFGVGLWGFFKAESYELAPLCFVLCVMSALIFVIAASVNFPRRQQITYTKPFFLSKTDECLIIKKTKDSAPQEIKDIYMWKNSDDLMYREVHGVNLWGVEGIDEEALVIQKTEK